MTNLPEIRVVERSDLDALKAIIDATELFPSHLLDEMIAGYFGRNERREIWLTNSEGSPKAIAFCAPEDMTEGTWNLLLIAVHPDKQHSGLGKALLANLETELLKRGARILLVETSGNLEFQAAWRFYERTGFSKEARIRDFYADGEDKLVFWKALKTR